MIVSGMPIALVAWSITWTASLSDSPFPRLKLIVTAGNCSVCCTESGAVSYFSPVKVESGTCEATFDDT